jgi:hypothetical protein
MPFIYQGRVEMIWSPKSTLDRHDAWAGQLLTTQSKDTVIEIEKLREELKRVEFTRVDETRRRLRTLSGEQGRRAAEEADRRHKEWQKQLDQLTTALYSIPDIAKPRDTSNPIANAPSQVPNKGKQRQDAIIADAARPDKGKQREEPEPSSIAGGDRGKQREDPDIIEFAGPSTRPIQIQPNTSGESSRANATSTQRSPPSSTSTPPELHHNMHQPQNKHGPIAVKPERRGAVQKRKPPATPQVCRIQMSHDKYSVYTIPPWFYADRTGVAAASPTSDVSHVREFGMIYIMSLPQAAYEQFIADHIRDCRASNLLT